MADEANTNVISPTASNGSGGIIGSLSAGIGDLDFGSSSAETGDQSVNTSKSFSFAAPVINDSDYTKYLLIGGGLIAAYFLFIR